MSDKMSDKRVIRAALLGAGVVGSGVYELAGILAEDIEYKTGAALEIKKVLVRNLNKKREGIMQEVLTDNWKRSMRLRSRLRNWLS